MPLLPRSLLTLVLLALSGVASAQAPGPDPKERAEHIRANYIKSEYRIPMRDGTRLFTAVYLPRDAGPGKRYPVLLMRTPYSVAPYGADRYRRTLGPSAAYEKERFIFVIQDVRGRFMSEGTFMDVRPHLATKRGPKDFDESTDAYDTIEWLVKNVPHNNNRVGLWGISYPGFYASTGAIDSHPSLKAVSPQAPVGDWFWDDMHRHGAFNLAMAFNFLFSEFKSRPGPTSSEESERFQHGTPDGYQFFLDMGPLSKVDARYLKGEVPFWKDLAAHPNYDDFWKARNILPHLRNIKAPVMVVGGWYDTEDLHGPLRTYSAIEKQNPGTPNMLIMGPWFHGGWQRSDGSALGDADFGFATSNTYLELSLAFFKHHLKGGEKPELPEALIFETGANRWRRFDAWPPKTARTARLYFQPKGALAFTAPAGTGNLFDEYLSDPAKPVPYTAEITPVQAKKYMAEDQRFASRRPDVLVYQTEPLDKDLTLAGPLEAELWVSTTGTDADWVVKLVDVNPGKMPGWSRADEESDKPDRGGQQTLVRGEPFRGRFRESFSSPKAFKPGEITKVRFVINDVFHTFKRGHRLMIQVQSSWFPFIDRNPQIFVPNIFEAKEEDFVRATHRLYRSQANPSFIQVNLLPSADE